LVHFPWSKEQTAPFLIVGLGNPGAQYRQNRHNVGFMLVDRLAARLKVTFSRLESKALVTKAEYAGHRLVLAKPQTYMNLSGQSVGSLARFYKTPPGQLLVAYDDVDLPLGTIRIRPDGGSAGQKGMASIIERLGTQEFPRLRLGIDRPPGRMEAADYVLQNFSSSEVEIIALTLERAVDAVLIFVSENLEAAMNKYNRPS
jgi:peptidyl-tRNA hydrolase, PTH1 family